MIPVMKPKLASFEDASKYLREIDSRRIYTNYGPLIKELERRYAEYFDIKSEHVVVLANATLAIQGCIEISQAEEWAVPNFTFAATAHAVLIAGKNLQLVEVGESDWKMDLKYVEPNKVGLLPVIPFGGPVNTSDYAEFDHVIIDAAASLGAPTPNLKSFSDEHFIVYSLHATKVLGAGEGAIVICGSEENARRLRSWANFGFSDARVSNFRGTNAKMSEFAAAYALAALDGRKHEELEWISALTYKSKRLEQIGADNVSDHYPGFRPYWIFDLNEDNGGLIAKFNARNIGNRAWWSSPISDMPAFATIPVVGGIEVSRRLSRNLIGLPMWRDISTDELDLILDVIAANADI